VCGDGPEVYNSGATYSLVGSCGCLDPAQRYTLHCSDSYGDGWNGAYVTAFGQQFCGGFRGVSQEEEIIPRLAVASGGGSYCQIDANGCATDGVGDYGNSEDCTIIAGVAGFLTATEFNTEKNFDEVTIGANQYSGSEGFSNIFVEAGSTFTWHSDSSVKGDGWTICFTRGYGSDGDFGSFINIGSYGSEGSYGSDGGGCADNDELVDTTVQSGARCSWFGPFDCEEESAIRAACPVTCNACPYGSDGDSGSLSSTVTTTAPTTTADLCTNEASGPMIANNKDCESWNGLTSKCNTKAGWRNNKFCQQSCFDLGMGYDGDSC